MSIENDNAHYEMLDEVYESRFGWAWIGSLATKTPEEGRTIARAPKKKFQLPPPERPKTTDIGNLWHWLNDSWREHRQNRQEHRTTEPINQLLKKEERVFTLATLNHSAWCALVVFGLPLWFPSVSKAAAARSEQPVDAIGPLNSVTRTELPLGPIDEQILDPWQPSSVEAWRWELAQRAQDQRAAG